MTRVLFWADAFWPQIGGVEVLSASFLPAMQDRGHAFAVVASQATGTAPDTGEFHGMPVYRFPFHEVLAANDLGRLAEIRAQLVDLKRKFRPDLVHVNVTGPGLFFHLQTAGVHASPLLMSLLIAPPARAGADTLFGRALSSAAWVTALSAAVLDPIRRAMPAIGARSSVVYAGLEMPGISPAPLRLAPPSLLVLGRLVPEKGVDVAVRAMRAIRERSPEARLTIAGDGPARRDLARLAAELGVADAIRFLGWVPPADVPALVNRADMVIVPSRWEEAFGLVALEAAQLARPAVVTRVGGLPEVVVDGVTGLIVERDDADALAEAVLTLIAHPDTARRMGEAGRRRAGEAFGWERYLGEYDALYRTLTCGRQRASGAAPC